MNKKNKRIIIIVVLSLLLLTIIALLIRLKNDSAVFNEPTEVVSSGAAQFLSEQEKLDMGINTEDPVQIFRDASGDNIVYKIIKTDSDIVADPSSVMPINPPQQLPISE